MTLEPTPLRGLVVVQPKVFGDDRGWFMESFNEPKFHAALAALGLPAPGPFVQDNHSRSQAGVLRGLHYQLPPHGQGKLVRVVRGAAWDVGVDLRPGSPTFGQWWGTELNEHNHRQLWLPEGFAHGFIALQDDTHFLYKTTAVYAPAAERAVLWNDPAIGIRWPLPPGLAQPLLAPKDAAAPPLKQAAAWPA